MGSEARALRILFFPLMAPGHMLPMVDMVKLFAAHGVKATILTTPGNVPQIQPSIDRANESGYRYPIEILLVPFPSVDGLPKGCENLSSVPQDLHFQFVRCFEGLGEPFGNILKQTLPDCLVTDMFFPWTADVAEEHGIPRLLFHGSNFFSQCVSDSIAKSKILESLSLDEESFVVPGLPHNIILRRPMVPDFNKWAPPLAELFQKVKACEPKNYGTVMNTFYELEPEYADYYRDVMGIKAWTIGPLSLCNKDIIDKSIRGKETSMDIEFCLKWLDSKKPCSVVYVCFGSLTDFTTSQLQEIALGLERSNHPFVWVVRMNNKEWMPQGFEDRVEGKGLIIKGWAPQILILNHGSIGGYMTHCGWNSTLEGISIGLPFITWPIFAEQFYNQRLIVDVLKIGVEIGMKAYAPNTEEREVIEAARVERAINELMGSGDQEAEERRMRARKLGEMAKKAVEKGGSSYDDMDNLIAELIERRTAI
ncbi:scopoletin glucosyltransferase-like [Asparagus officinalis]|uniref:scopoletin glucosyltransferase-like n=1 Tax=Asparagus officinalis TaxID=4686 RepID=UPI00098E7900|nr:scopoletin glucosyltransferase-like [Asparagus officinalis]